MSIRYAHTNIIAQDWRGLMAFYESVFDCVFVPPQRLQSGQWLDDATGVKDAALEGVHLRLPGHGKNGPTLEIYSYKNMEEKPIALANRKGYGHLAFEVDDVTSCLEKVIDAGGREIGKVTKKEVPGAGIITVVYAADPEDNIIELQSWD